MRISEAIFAGAVALTGFIYGTFGSDPSKRDVLEKIHRYDTETETHHLDFGANKYRSKPVTYAFQNDMSFEDFKKVWEKVEASQGRLDLEGVLGLCRKVDRPEFGADWNTITTKETTNAKKALVDGNLYSN